MARRKTGGAAGAGGSEAASASGGVSSEVAVLQQSMAQMQQGLTQLVGVAAVHTELLRAVLAATTVEVAPEKNLAILLEHIVGHLGEQAGLLRRIGTSMANLPADVGAEVGERMALALADVR